eukprot:3680134-Pyramimonas_sp.AAC.1
MGHQYLALHVLAKAGWGGGTVSTARWPTPSLSQTGDRMMCGARTVPDANHTAVSLHCSQG